MSEDNDRENCENIMDFVPAPSCSEDKFYEDEIFDPGYKLTVRCDELIRDVRPFILTCIINNLDMTDDRLRRFINLQSKLHQRDCKDRKLASIATHDLEKLTLPVRYEARPAKKTMMRVLGEVKDVNIHRLLNVEDPLEKKRRAVDRYRHHLVGCDMVPVLIDNTNTVISLHPVTNCEKTRVTTTTTSLLVEVTSTVSIDICQRIMDSLIELTVPLCPELKVQQMRIINFEGDTMNEFMLESTN